MDIMSQIKDILNQNKEDNFNSTMMLNLCGFWLIYNMNGKEIYRDDEENYITFDLEEKFITFDKNIHIGVELYGAIGLRMAELGWINKYEVQ